MCVRHKSNDSLLVASLMLFLNNQQPFIHKDNSLEYMEYSMLTKLGIFT